MPLQCSESVLTGADGLVTFAPLNSSACLLAADFAADTDNTIDVGSANFKKGDAVQFTEEDGAVIDGGLTVDTTYWLLTGKDADNKVTLTATEDGSEVVTLSGDGEDNGGHVNMTYEGTEAICSVQDWSLSLVKGQVDVTTLPCKVNCSSDGNKVAPVRKQQGTFLEGEGTMNIMFTGDSTSNGTKLLQGSIMNDSRVYAKLYISAVCGSDDKVDDGESLYYAGYVNLLGFSLSVNTTDAIVAEVNFAVADTPDAIFGVEV